MAVQGRMHWSEQNVIFRQSPEALQLLTTAVKRSLRKQDNEYDP